MTDTVCNDTGAGRADPGALAGTLAAVHGWRTRGESLAVCVVMHTERSTYRKAGAVAAFSERGAHAGVISGGCLEADLYAAAAETIARNSPRLTIFDTQDDDDVLFGSGSGCRGRMQVIILPITGNTPCPWLDLLHANAAAGSATRLAVALEGDNIGSGWCIGDARSEAIGSPPASLMPLRDLAPGMHRLRDAGDIMAGAVLIAALPRLLLIGAGPEAPPLLRMAREMGWHCALLDHRPALLKERAAFAAQSMCARPAAGLAALAQQHFDAALLMTHSASLDAEALRALAPRAVDFVGMLGPPARRDELLAQLTADERAALAPRLQAPVGLRLGGHGPEALALSIAAAIQQWRELQGERSAVTASVPRNN